MRRSIRESLVSWEPSCSPVASLEPLLPDAVALRRHRTVSWPHRAVQPMSRCNASGSGLYAGQFGKHCPVAWR